ncbi:MAG: hypothetical protein L0G02_08135 [Lactococcus lactis]|nr:hypothetical protein [Chryseobacterium sp.]MDN5470371.1 hypothetical protein [Lactococcus lactis]
MKTVKYTLVSGQEIELTPEDIKALKPIVDAAFANLDDSLLKHLRWSSPKAIQTELATLSDDKLLELAKLNDLNPMNGHNISVFTNKIRSELFKRNGLGHKQINHLSYKQRSFLESLGLRTK